MRKFRSSTGRMWSVEVAQADQLRIGSHRSTIATSTEVLRFSSRDGLICDLENYPSDWDRFTDMGLLSLLGQAMADWVGSTR
jgi:hypothetical protein